jgi:small-conductance mechanosensitive channel
MWHHVFENTLPAIAGAGVVGLIFGLTKQRSAAWIALMVLMFTLIAASTQITKGVVP